MLNTSITSLSLRGLMNVQYSTSSLNKFTSFSLSKSHISRSFSTFSYFHNFKGSASFASTTFHKFLNTPIKVDSTALDGQIYESSRQSFTNLVDNVLDIKSCIFSLCTSPTEEGGALYVHNPDVNYGLSISRSSFDKCTAHSHGGAVSFDGSYMTQSNNCFSACIATDSQGQAVMATTRDNNNLYFEGCSVVRCSPAYGQDDETQSPLNFVGGKQRLTESNISKCTAGYTYGAFYTDDSSSLIFTFTNIEKNRGNIIVGIEDTRINDDISYVNFVENTVQNHDYGIIYLSEGTATIKKCVFKENTPILFHATSNVAVTLDSCYFTTKYGAENYTSMVSVTDRGCSVKPNAYTFAVSVFDSRYCWMVNPPGLRAGPATYAFLLVFVAFAGLVSYFTFMMHVRINGVLNKAPLVTDNKPSYDEMK